MIKAKAWISACASIPLDGDIHTHLEKTSSILAMSSKVHSQYCLSFGDELPNNADEYETLQTCFRDRKIM